MPDASGHPLPGEPGYDDYAKTQSQAASTANAGATLSREGVKNPSASGTADGPVDSNGHPLPGNIHYDEYARSMGQAGSEATSGAEHSKAVDSQQPPGALANPGPFETWASEHAGDFNDPSAAESFYSAHGQDWNNPSNIETLYGQGIGQLNPYYDYASQVGTKSINDAAAAHGGFSSTALSQINLLNANLRGQQAKEMAGMATQADAARLARYGLGESEAQAADKGKLDRYGAASSLYGTWQDKEEARLTGAFTSQMNLSKAQADQVDTFFKNLIEAGKYDAEGINAALQAAGVDPNSAFGKDLISVGKAYATSYAGKIPTGGGGGGKSDYGPDGTGSNLYPAVGD